MTSGQSLRRPHALLHSSCAVSVVADVVVGGDADSPPDTTSMGIDPIESFLSVRDTIKRSPESSPSVETLYRPDKIMVLCIRCHCDGYG